MNLSPFKFENACLIVLSRAGGGWRLKEENNLSASFHPAEIIFMNEKKNSQNIFLHGAQKTQRQESISEEVIMFMILLPGKKSRLLQK